MLNRDKIPNRTVIWYHGILRLESTSRSAPACIRNRLHGTISPNHINMLPMSRWQMVSMFYGFYNSMQC